MMLSPIVNLELDKTEWGGLKSIFSTSIDLKFENGWGDEYERCRIRS